MIEVKPVLEEPEWAKRRRAFVQEIVQELQELQELLLGKAATESEHEQIQSILKSREQAIQYAESQNGQRGPVPKAEFHSGDKGTGKLHSNSTRLSRSRDETFRCKFDV